MNGVILTDVTKRYGEKVVLSRLSCTFPAGQVTALSGPSGSGKTTVLRLIAALTAPDSGSITGGGAGRVSMAFQEPRLLPQLTTEENLCTVLGGRMRDHLPAVRELLAEAGMESAAGIRASALSGGMASRVSLLRALLFDRPVLLLDEPFAGVDAASRDALLPLFRRMTARKTVIFVSHIPTEIDFFCDQTVRLSPIT